MKSINGLLLVMACVAIFLFVRSNKIEKQDQLPANPDTVVVFSPEARAIIDNKCFGCHNPESKNEKAKKKLQWDNIPTLAKAKQIAMLDEILEVLEKGEMPPAKFLEMKPEARLTEEEAKLLTDWANTNADKLMK
jgi:cytochrome c551/c552